MHGFSRDGKAGLGEMLGIVGEWDRIPAFSKGFSGREELPPLMGLEENHGEERDHEEDE